MNSVEINVVRNSVYEKKALDTLHYKSNIHQSVCQCGAFGRGKTYHGGTPS